MDLILFFLAMILFGSVLYLIAAYSIAWEVFE